MFSKKKVGNQPPVRTFKTNSPPSTPQRPPANIYTGVKTSQRKSSGGNKSGSFWNVASVRKPKVAQAKKDKKEEEPDVNNLMKQIHTQNKKTKRRAKKAESRAKKAEKKAEKALAGEDTTPFWKFGKKDEKEGAKPATIDSLLKQINEQNKESEKRANEQEKRAEKAEERAEKAEERADKAEAKVKELEEKIETMLNNINNIGKSGMQQMFCF